MIGYLPPGLHDIVASLTYKPDWSFYLSDFTEGPGVRGVALHIISDTENSLPPFQRIRVNHEFLIPPASYNHDTWVAWIFDRVRDVETHEAGEFFRVNDERVFAPHHGNGENPYLVWHHGTEEQRAKKSGDD